jgi:hypothetical protein
MALMDILNPEGCYELPPVSLEIDISQALPENWLEVLCVFIERHLPEQHEMLEKHEGQPESTVLKVRLNEQHIGGTYTSMGPFIESLHFIFRCINEDGFFSRDDSISISLKLAEGIAACTAGFHDRALEVILGIKYKQESIKQYLYQYRQDLVQKTRAAKTNEVHANNRFFLVANYSGYGVFSISTFDVHTGFFSDAHIEGWLADTFRDDYTPIKMLKEVLERLETKLSHEGVYRGCLPEGESYVDADLREWDKLFSAMLEREVAPGTFSQLDDWSIPTDINWPKLAFYILNYFFDKNILNTEHYEGLMSYLHSVVEEDDEEAETLPFPIAAVEALLANEEDRYLFQQCFPVMGELGKKDLWSCYADEFKDESFIFKMLTSPTLNKKQKCVGLHKLWVLPQSQWDTQLCRFKTSTLENLLMIVVNQSDEVLSELLGFVQHLDIGNQRWLLTSLNNSGKNILTLAIEKKLPSCLKLLELIKGLDTESIANILMQVDEENGQNALMKALVFMPALIPELCDLMKRFTRVRMSIQKTTAETPASYEIRLNTYLLTCIDKEGKNILMLMKEVDNAHLPSLIDWIKTLDKTTLHGLLTTPDKEGNNVLMLSIEKKSSFCSTLLELIKELDAKSIATIFLQVDEKTGQNALMKALVSMPALIPELCELIEKLTACFVTITEDKDEVPRSYKCEMVTYLLTFADKERQTLLMLMKEEDNANLSALFKVIKTLHRPTQLKLLSAVDKDNQNVLMRCVGSNTVIPTELFELVESEDSGELYPLLAHTDESGQNVLEKAIDLSHPDMPVLFDLIASLPQEQKSTLFCRLDEGQWEAIFKLILTSKEKLFEVLGWFVDRLKSGGEKPKINWFSAMWRLIFLTIHDPRHVMRFELMSYLEKVTPKAFSILMRTVNSNAQNLLMIALSQDLELVVQLLTLLEQCENDALEQILCQHDVSDNTALLLALKKAPHLVQPICQLLQKAKPSIREYELCHCDKHENSTLELAVASSDETALSGILGMINTFDTALKESFFTHCDGKKRNPLMIALQHGSEHIALLLESIDCLDEEVQHTIFRARDNKKQSSLDLAIRFNPDALPHLCMRLKKLRPFTLYLMLSYTGDRKSDLLLESVNLIGRGERAESILEPLCDLISTLPLKDKEKVLSYVEKKSLCSILELMLVYQAINHRPLCDLIQGCSHTLITSLFDKLSLSASLCERLSEVLSRDDEHANAIWGLMAGLSPSEIYPLFLKSVYSSETLLTYAFEQGTEAVNRIFESLMTFDEADLFNLLNKGFKTKKNALFVAIEAYPTQIPAICGLLERLPKALTKKLAGRQDMLKAAVLSCPEHVHIISHALFGKSYDEVCQKHWLLGRWARQHPLVLEADAVVRDERRPAQPMPFFGEAPEVPVVPVAAMPFLEEEDKVQSSMV